jgi:glutaredoxin
MRTIRYLLMCLLIPACHHSSSSRAADAGASAALPGLPAPISVNDSRKDLIFTWQDANGAFHDTSHVADVPAPFRKHVLVRDLSLPPEQVHADQYLYLADLSEKDADGGYPYAVVSRYHFQLPRMVEESDGGFEEAQVTIYGTSWCGACAEARKYFTGRHIPFVDKDIEKDGQAAAELARKAKRAGFTPRGVPVIDVRGHLLEGFSPQAVEEALRGS